MQFPTLEQVEAADRFQLCRWHRFLPSATNEQDHQIQNRIYCRWREAGGFTPEISKAIGWEASPL